MKKYVTLGEVCTKGSSNIAQKDIEQNNGSYGIYGASGYIKDVDFYHQDKPYIAVVKDGAGIGRTMLLPEKTSVIGTMQYLIPNDDVCVEYLYYAVTYMNLAKYFSGATIPHIYFRDYQKEKLPLLTIEEQRKIADNLRKIDRLIELCGGILQKLDVLVKSRFVEMFGDTEVNSNNHPVHKLSDLCTVSSSKRIYQEEQSSSGVPFLRISNLVELIDNGRFGSDLFIPEEKYNELFTNGLVPKADDILVTSRGTLGKCYIIQEHDKFYFQDGMISWLYDIDKSITPLYLTLLFDTRDIKRQIDNLQSGSTVAYLSIAMLKKLNIVVPPLALQEQFATFVEQTDKSKLAVKQVLEKAETLKKALMQEYFG